MDRLPRFQLCLALLLLASALACKQQQPKEKTLTPEAKAYARNLKLTGVSMQASESYARQVLTEIQGKITNTGNRTVNSAEVACLFFDSAGRMVLREQVVIVRNPLKPGETRPFRLPFDDIPTGWDNQVPQLVIARLDLS